ncbi:hypothetical protein B0T16DRAFT_395707 [Cercophora newfieldiana]|uniref:Uncharacterized protein n=1 Tax=Cercophora newfieldiana TaxID=92897 RepID=A0AA39YLJ2_9PEZI|nr:hypothetical protein B0T16DRAFT_395707 [Cercophora newfieldiana]
MDPRLKGLFDDFQSGSETWRGKCIEKLRQAAEDGADIAASLVGEDGVRGIAVGGNNATWEPAQAWGVDINTCYEYCSRAKFPMVFNYQVFLGRATNYLLPWLALTAQLPFEAGGAMANILSFCMSLGSPALATYSLVITILNQNWLRRLCNSLPKYEDGENQIPNPYTTRMSSVRVLLEAAQQAPLRISDADGSLSSLIILEANNSWWNSVEKRLQATKRTVTISLVAQMLVAVGAWILTVAGSFMSSLGDHTEALVLSSSALWTWLVPVIWGWIAVGTQSTSNTIDDTLSEFTLLRAGHQDAPPHRTSNQEGFRVVKHHPNERLPKFLIFSICGDEIQQGPTFNYARVFTWWHATKTVHTAFERVATKYNKRHPLSGRRPGEVGASQGTPTAETGTGVIDNNTTSPSPSDKETTPSGVQPGDYELQTLPQPSPFARDPSPHPHDPTLSLTGGPRALTFRMRNLNGTTSQLRAYCGFAPHDNFNTSQFDPYPPWSAILSDADLWKRIIVAAGFGLAVQWGTTIPAVIIAYLTDVKGLGCRSGSYLIYGVAGTVAFLLMFLSTLLSHGAMLAIQGQNQGSGMHGDERVIVTPQGGDGANPDDSVQESVSVKNGDVIGRGAFRSAGSSTLAFLAVSTRLLGRAIAVANAFWIILSSLWELVGFYDSCWCEGTTLSTGQNAWIVLFKRAVDLSERAEGPWAGGVTMSFVVAFLSWLGFVLLCRDSKER